MTLLISIFSENPGVPIAGAEVMLAPRKRGTAPPITVRTDDEGEARIRLPERVGRDYRLVVNAPDHVPLCLETFGPEPAICLARLPKAEDGLGWWHHAMGISAPPTVANAGLVVGVIDSGCSPRRDAATVRDCGSVINSEYFPDSAGTDSEGHGTAVIGLLVNHPAYPVHFGGVAPGISVLSLKAFDSRLGKFTTGTQGEVAEAIYHLVELGADLVNCSFGLDENHVSVAQQVEEAHERGVLCICASGNRPDGVAFPGGLDCAVAVAAIGRGDAVQPDTLVATHMPPRRAPDWSGPYFFASFSGRGPGTDCCAPGVGLIAPAVPQDGLDLPFQVVSGTSFACPLVCGILATTLAADPGYQALPRNASRAAYARRHLDQLCQTLGFPPEWEGRGMPRLRTHP